MNEPIYTIPDTILQDISIMENESEITFHFLNVDYPKLHSHSHWELFIQLSGEIEHEINQSSSRLKPGDAYLIRPTDKHRFCAASITHRHLNFLIDDKFIKKYFNVLHNDLYNLILNDEKSLHFQLNDLQLQEVLRYTIHIQYNQSPIKSNFSTKAIYLKLIVEQLLNTFFKQYLSIKNSPEWLDNFLVQLNSPSNYSKTVNELALLTPYSYSRLSRIFKNVLGMTLIEYITLIKIEHSKALLTSSHFTILEISSILGFASLSYFNHIFLKHVGLTPKEYRKSH